MSKYIDLGKKLNALAQRGIGGEKSNARRMLNNLMQKYDITKDEIEGEKINEYFFQITKKEFRLWHQIVRNIDQSIDIYGCFPQKMIKEYKLKGNYSIKTTAANYIEILSKYNFYSNLLNTEYDIFFRAFIQANKLYIIRKKGNDNLNKEEFEKELRVYHLSKHIKVGEFRKALTKSAGKKEKDD